MVDTTAASAMLANISRNAVIPKHWGDLNKDHVASLQDLLLTALKEQRSPMAYLATIWQPDGKSVTDIVDFLRDWVNSNPVKNGSRTNKHGETVQRYRKRPRILFQWTLERKKEGDPDSIRPDGVHVHILLIIDTHSFQKKLFMEHLQTMLVGAGLVHEDPRAWMVTGAHKLDSMPGLSGCFSHSLYICKTSQKNFAGKVRGMGSSLNLLKEAA